MSLAPRLRRRKNLLAIIPNFERFDRLRLNLSDCCIVDGIKSSPPCRRPTRLSFVVVVSRLVGMELLIVDYDSVNDEQVSLLTLVPAIVVSE